jgi:hypothetical protein
VLTIVPLTLRDASAFVTLHHRHHRPPQGRKVSLGVVDGSGVMAGLLFAVGFCRAAGRDEDQDGGR